MTTGAHVTVADPGAAVARINEICDLYDSVFSQPPFHWTPAESDHHRRMMTRVAGSPSFSISLLTAPDGRLVGFACGITLPPDTNWWHGVTPPLPDEVHRERQGRTFAVIDMAVHPDWRGRGHGRRLLDTLLTHRPEERATLCVQPPAQATQEFYRHLGWEYVGRTEGAPDEVSPRWDVFVLDLRGAPTPDPTDCHPPVAGAPHD